MLSKCQTMSGRSGAGPLRCGPESCRVGGMSDGKPSGPRARPLAAPQPTLPTIEVWLCSVTISMRRSRQPCIQHRAAL